MRQVRPPIDWTSLASRRLDKSGPEISPGQVQPRDKSGLKVFGTSPASKFLDMSGLETSPAPKCFGHVRPRSVLDMSGLETSPAPKCFGHVWPRDKSGPEVFWTCPASRQVWPRSVLDMSGLETSPAPKITLATSFKTRRPKFVVSGSVRPKFGIDIGNRNQYRISVSVSVPKPL